MAGFTFIPAEHGDPIATGKYQAAFAKLKPCCLDCGKNLTATMPSSELAAKKRAREDGKIVGKIANFNRQTGRATVHLLVELEDGRKVFGCGARAWNHGIRSSVADDATVTCSRCAKREAAAAGSTTPEKASTV